MVQISEQRQVRSLTPLIAWRNVLGITILAWLIIALPNFGFLTNFLARSMQHNVLLASFYLDLGFFVSCAVVIGLVYWWQHIHGETLADLGWGRPTTALAIILAIIFGALWAVTTYLNTRAYGLGFLDFPWERFIMAPIGIALALAEELLFRGFLMEQLRRAGVATWIQILASGAAIATYHGLIGWNYSLEYAISSFVLFSIIALIHVVGKRSLTPNWIAHAMAHFFGDPALTMGILVGAQLLLHLR
ncbi:MAG TPA: CPBP family glutamic-type intramembrane protease [Ktedonobacteraceae bacterium]|jgi:membrane protease YdiL (CAAX protease family)